LDGHGNVIPPVKPKPHSPDLLATLVRSVLGVPPARIEADTYGATNAVYFVTLEDGRECVLRISIPEACTQVAAQVWAMAACAARGVLVPRVLAHDTTLRTFPEPYMILERLPGAVLPRAGLDGRATQNATQELGRQLALIHSVQVTGFGPLEPLAGDLATAYRGTYDTLWPAIEAELTEWLHALGPEAAPPDLQDEIWTSLHHARARRLFDLVAASLIHRDFHFRNALAADGKLSGVLDFDKTEAGDPVRDFTIIRPGDVPLLRQGYERVRPLDGRFQEKLALYRLISAIERLWHHPAPDRIQEIRDHMTYLLSLC
jgi:aminoglycoside phosphotransferase (APT) family kinase protein